MTATTAGSPATPQPERVPLRSRTSWEAILPTDRSPALLAVVVFFTTVIQVLIDPVAFVIDGTQEWPYPIPLGVNIFLAVLACAVQAGALLVATRWPTGAVVATIVIYVVALLVLNAPNWITPMQLPVAAALFLLSTRSSARRSLITVSLIVIAQVVGVVAWVLLNGVPLGEATGFLLGRIASFAAPVFGAVVVGLWWGTQTRRVVHEREQAEQARRDRENEMARARELERARIAQELHDVAAQHIAGLMSLTDAAITIAGDRPGEAIALLEEVRVEGRFAAASLYGALGDLRATGTAHAEATPGAHQIDDLVTFWGRRDLQVTSHIAGDVGSLPAVVSATAYRVAQEAATNAAKYAPGADVDISLIIDASRAVVVVTNGPARRPAPASPGTSLKWGLTGLGERIVLLGGTFSAGPAGAGGWQVRADIPVADTSHAPALEE